MVLNYKMELHMQSNIKLEISYLEATEITPYADNSSHSLRIRENIRTTKGGS
jgi:hypothetical protein